MAIGPFSGDGPGAQAPDGCSVALYARLPYRGEIEPLTPLLRPGLSVLELGCGTGRLTRRLLALGCAVTAVDNSAEMLAHVPPEALRVRADIEQLRLTGRFDRVLLASGLINHADAAVRAAFTACAAAHLGPAGRFIVQRQDPAWLASAVAGPLGEIDGIVLRLLSVERREGVIEMTLAYSDGAATWTHSFSLVALHEAALQAQLSAAGFGPISWLDEGRRWASAALVGQDQGQASTK